MKWEVGWRRGGRGGCVPIFVRLATRAWIPTSLIVLIGGASTVIVAMFREKCASVPRRHRRRDSPPTRRVVHDRFTHSLNV